jgi:hypothetical protein
MNRRLAVGVLTHKEHEKYRDKDVLMSECSSSPHFFRLLLDS